MIISVNIISELLAAAICTVIMLLKPSALNKRFCWFLWLTTCAEVTGRFLMLNKIPNAFLYNFFNPVEILFYLFILRQPVKTNYKRLLLALSVFYTGAAVINLVFIQGYSKYNNYTVTLGSLFVIAASLLILLTWMTNNERDNRQLIPYTLIATGILIFYTGAFAYNQLINYLVENHLDKDRHYFNLIFQSLNPVLYSIFTVALYVEFHFKTLKE